MLGGGFYWVWALVTALPALGSMANGLPIIFFSWCLTSSNPLPCLFSFLPFLIITGPCIVDDHIMPWGGESRKWDIVVLTVHESDDSRS